MASRILVVEDNESWRDVLKTILESDGYNVETIADYSQANQRLDSDRYDLVIVDIELPNGSDVFGRGKILLDRVAKSKEAGLIVISGSDISTPSAVRDYLKKYKASDFIWKLEFDPKCFRKTVEKALEEAARVTDAALSEITWVHLSDVHFECTEQRRYEIEQVVKALVKDLGKLREDHLGVNPDAIFFTGDLANKALSDEFTRAFQDCLDPILRTCGLNSSGLYIVPGNHDVHRIKTTDLDASLIQGLRSTAQVHALLNDRDWEGYRQQLLQRMENYAVAIGGIAGLPFDAGALSWARTLTTNSGGIIGVVGLNSVWTSASNKGWDGEVDDQGKLIVGRPALQSALDEIGDEQPPDTNVALMHHPLDWLQDWDRQDVRQVLGETCQFILHGHAHETSVSFLGTPNPSTMVISAGCLYKEYDRRDAHTCLHAYNVVRLDLANRRGTIFFRRYDPVSERYGADDTTFEDVRDGRYSFRYGEDGFRSGGDAT